MYYLVPISLVYLFSQFGDQTYPLSLIVLIGAASRHSEGEAIYGPDGDEIVESSHEEKIRRIGTLIFRAADAVVARPPHHEVLDVVRDVSDVVMKVSARQKLKEHHLTT